MPSSSFPTQADFEALNARAQQFAQEATAAAEAAFAGDAAYRTLAAQLLAQMQDDEQIPMCEEHRGRFYHFYQSADRPKGVYRVSSAAMYRAGAPDWQVLFDVADFDALLGDEVFLEGVAHCVTMPTRVLLSLSRLGGDAAYTLELDLARGALAEEAMNFPLGKNHIAWRDEDSLWVAPAWEGEPLTASGYPKAVYLLRRGQDFSQAVKVIEGGGDDMLVHAWRYLDGQGAPVDLAEVAHGFFRKTYYQILPDLQTRALALPQDAEIVGYLAGQLLVQLKSAWRRANRIYASGCLVAVKLNQGVLGAAQVLFEPAPGQALQEVETTRAFVVIHYLDNISGCLKLWRFGAGVWQEAAAPQLPGHALEIVDQPWGGDVITLAASDFVTPLTLYSVDLQLMEVCVLRRQKPQFEAAGITVRQLWAKSADGTAVPYWYVGSGSPKPGPVWVYGYGGFGIAQLPHYLGSIGKHWLEAGGAFVLANLRGGSEFGPAWHQAAQGVDKIKSVEDFIAVAEHLAQSGLAAPEKIALQGGSNGGLVAAAAFARAPELIGALVCEAPLTDMLRYPYLAAGASWLDEYGDPADPAFQAALTALSPLHNLSADKTYPPALITTRLNDDRVHPAHALAFYARLKALGQKAWLYCPKAGGHSGEATQADEAQELALILRFLQSTLGVTPVDGARADV